jgi:hypothetical protein
MALLAMQAGIADEFILHPHGYSWDDIGTVMLLQYGDVDSHLGIVGDSVVKTQYNRPRHCGR